MPTEHYLALGGHAESITPLAEALAERPTRLVAADERNPWPGEDDG